MQGWEFAVVAGVLLLLFGGSRLPKLARSLGEARTELDKVRQDAKAGDEPPVLAVTEAAVAPPSVAPSVEVVSVAVADEVVAPAAPAAFAAPAVQPLPPPLPPPGA